MKSSKTFIYRAYLVLAEFVNNMKAKNNMERTFLLLSIFLIGGTSSCISQLKKGKSPDIKQESFWNLDKAKKQAEDFNSSDKWNVKTLKMEVENLDKYPPSDFPLYPSPFPTPEYVSPGNGNGSIETEIGGKKIIGQNIIIGNGEHSTHLFKNPADKNVSYFTILTIADGEKTKNPVLASSRNHPHYLSQGSLNTSTKSRVDWVAVQLADKNAYAIINSRLFDLRVGRIILVAPQKDGSIRFYQTDAKPMNSTELNKYIENLKSGKAAISFFAEQGNI